MPSKRPKSPSSLDDSPPKPHKSNKRSRSSRPKKSHHQRRLMDPDHPNSPNPPNPSRKSVRKRKPLAFPDSASGAGAEAHRSSSAGAVQKLWTDADEIALLTGAAAFRTRTRQVPRLPDMGALYDSIKSNLSPHIDQAKVYYKLKRLKSKFLHTAPASSASVGPHDRRVRELSADVWGAASAAPRSAPQQRHRQSTTVVQYLNGDDVEYDDEEENGNGNGEEEENNAARSYPLVSEVLEEYWKVERHGLSGVSLEKGIKLIDEEVGRVLDGKWRRQVETEMRTGIRRHDMAKEIYGMLIEAVKGLGP